MKILISFCNQSPESHKKNLLLYDFDTGSGRYLFNKNENFTGLCQDKRYIYAVMQGRDNRLIIYSKLTLRPICNQKLRHATDAHSIVVGGKNIYVVSTGTDSILQYEFDKETRKINYIKKIWGLKGSDCTKDTNHMNSICKKRNNIYISAFGPKKDEKWSSAKNGFILDIRKDKYLVRDIYHPHSAVIKGKNIFYCESASSSIKMNKNSVINLESGYVRGLVLSHNYIIFGVSGGRIVSKSTGTINSFAETKNMTPDCKVIVYKKKINGGYHINKEVDLTFKHAEIYDIIMIEK